MGRLSLIRALTPSRIRTGGARDERRPEKKIRKRKLLNKEDHKSTFDDCSINLSLLFSNHGANDQQSVSTQNTEEMSIIDSAPKKMMSSTYVFDFDPGVSLDLGIDFNANVAISNGTKDQPNHRKENHNEFLARKFNRKRIEKTLDLLCPVEIDNSVVEKKYCVKIDNRVEEKNHPAKIDSGVVDKKITAQESKRSLISTSIEGFSIEAGQLNDSGHMESGNDEFGIQPGAIHPRKIQTMYAKIPTSIDFINDYEEDGSTIGDGTFAFENEIGRKDNNATLRLESESPDKEESQLSIMPSSTYDTNCSPNGVEDFDLIHSVPKKGAYYNHRQMEISSPTVQVQTTQNQQRRMISTTLSKSNDAIIHVKSRLNSLAATANVYKGKPISPISFTSFSSSNSYDSVNILKIKSRLRQIEAEYHRIKLFTV
jgi:hypothetical protein